MAKKTSISVLPIILTILLFFSLLGNGYQYFHTAKIDAGPLVIGVVDGDTIVLENKTRVRLRHVDAPELAYCGGAEAKNELEKLTVGKHALITEQIPDQYGRSMALIAIDGTLMNEELLSHGLVRYHSDKTTVTERLKDVGNSAEQNRLGIYGMCVSKDTPDKPGCVIKGNIDKNSTRKAYYLPDCAQYKFTVVEKDIGEGWFCTEKEAVDAGFTKAETCKR